MIILGIILALCGYFFLIHPLLVIGIILLVIGAVLFVAQRAGHGVGGRYWY